MRLTLANVTDPVADVLNMNTAGRRVIYYINRACEELLNKGRWVGTTIKYRICTREGFITWPREIQTIEAMMINGRGTVLENQWYQFQDYGPGLDDWQYYGGGAGWANGYARYPMGMGFGIDEREAISFADVCPAGNPKKLKVYGTALESANAQILLQFYDNLGNYIRSSTATGWVDGEYVGINATTPQTTINVVSAWVGVQKPMTNGVVRITELDTVTGLERLLAVYEPSETNPSYRRTLLPGFCGTNSTPCPTTVTVIGSQRFIPAHCPTDYLPLTSSPAIVYKAKACYLKDNNNYQLAMGFDKDAETVLNDELQKWTGTGTIQTPRINAQEAACTGIPNFI
jgi:hypothetical protein